MNVSKNHDMENEGRKEVNNDIDEMESILQSSLNNDKEYEIKQLAIRKKRIMKRKTVGTISSTKKKTFETSNSIKEKADDSKTSQKDDGMVILDETPLCTRIVNHMKLSSLFIFHRDWQIRKLIRKMVNRDEFNYIIFALILCNIVVLCFDNPWVKPSSTSEYCLFFFNYFFNSFTFVITGD